MEDGGDDRYGRWIIDFQEGIVHQGLKKKKRTSQGVGLEYEANDAFDNMVRARFRSVHKLDEDGRD
jgi:hypothetical protein